MEQEFTELTGELMAMNLALKCSDCVAIVLNHRAKVNLGEIAPESEEPPMNDAVTMAPSWQTRMVHGNMMMACVALPSCLDHLEVSGLTPEQRATLGGYVLPGTAGMG